MSPASGSAEQGADPGRPAPVESFDPDDVRPWRFHNRRGSGMEDWLLDALADSIRRNGQQQPGLARRLPRSPGPFSSGAAARAAANKLRTQRGGWERAVVEAVRDADGDAAKA